MRSGIRVDQGRTGSCRCGSRWGTTRSGWAPCWPPLKMLMLTPLTVPMSAPRRRGRLGRSRPTRWAGSSNPGVPQGGAGPGARVRPGEPLGKVCLRAREGRGHGRHVGVRAVYPA